jgi:Flp pilus assembly protein TadG
MNRRKGQRGSSLPETALVMAILLALLFGIIDFGRALYTYAFVAQLARQGARWAIVRGSQCTALNDCNATSAEIQTYVQGLSEGATVSANIKSTTTWGSCPAGASAKNAPGCTVTVTVSYPFQFMLPYMPLPNGGVITMASSSAMVISQ